MKKVIVRIKGGIGNQLFCYAMARRLSLVNNAELVLDDITGFKRDTFQRAFMLDHFNVKGRRALMHERLEPFAPLRRRLLRWFDSRRPLEQRYYIEEEQFDFDERIYRLQIKGTVYLDGYWQNEKYFKDVDNVIQQDLGIIPPTDITNVKLAKMISSVNSVAVHVRFFDKLQLNSMRIDYYEKAIDFIMANISDPHFFLFSDDVNLARTLLPEHLKELTIVNHNDTVRKSYADLWLMTLCNHLIIADSTFSWWGAWLAKNNRKIVVAPGKNITNNIVWGGEKILPSSWIIL